MIRTRLVCLCLALALLPAAASALALQLPATARQTAERISPLDGYGLPMGPYDGTAVPILVVEGQVERRTWRIDGGAFTTLQVLTPLRDQLQQAGFDTLFECQSETCGGFDFRFGIEVVPAPDMHVDIQDFRFLSARHETGQVASLLVSRSRTALFVQAVLVLPDALPPVALPAPDVKAAITSSETETPAAEPGMIDRLKAQGHVILEDLAFATGGSALQDRSYDSLQALAEFLDENPDLRIVLVGHTDSVGDLNANIRLSKRRAGVVRSRMISDYDVDPARVDAEGNGYLSPIASNLTEAGREANRRVEVILLPR